MVTPDYYRCPTYERPARCCLGAVSVEVKHMNYDVTEEPQTVTVVPWASSEATASSSVARRGRICPVPRPLPQAPLMALPSPILRGMSRPCYNVLRRAADRSGGLPQCRGKKAFWNSY